LMKGGALVTMTVFEHTRSRGRALSHWERANARAETLERYSAARHVPPVTQ
jgi:hypothetical protein